MKILFAGTPDFAVPSLKIIMECSEIVGVLTAPDRPKGRGRHTGFSEVKQAALEYGLPILQPWKLDKEFLSAAAELDAQLLVCAAYGKLFKESFLGMFPLGGVNVHPSLLPIYRGPSPINAAILSGDRITGVTVQRLAMKMDTGDILAQREYPLDGTETAASLSVVLARIGGAMLPDVVRGLADGTIRSMPQTEDNATYCSLINKHDGELSWTEDAAHIERMIRAYTPWPGVSAQFGNRRLFFKKATVYPGEKQEAMGAPGSVTGVDKEHGILIHTIQGILAVQELQIEFRKTLSWREFINGNKDILGCRLGGCDASP